MVTTVEYKTISVQLFCYCFSIDNDVLTSFKQNLQVLKQVVHKAKDVSVVKS